MDIAFFIYDGIAPLDIIGPFEVLARVPDVRALFVGAKTGPCRTKGGSLALVADYALAEVTRPDIIVVPGGPGADAMAADPEVTEWIRAVHATTRWTTSVCTGALILGGAGILKGLEATTHWRGFDALAGFGARPVRERVVTDGKVITAAGVSSGIDMALALAARIGGDETARAIQLLIEYAPEPPFDSGNFTAAPAALIERANTGLKLP